MSLSDAFNQLSAGMGILDKNTLFPGTITEAVVNFILQNLPLWANDNSRPHEDLENKLNSSLCDFLDVTAREKFYLIRFHHEQPQDGQRRVDLSVKAAQNSGIKVSGCTYSIYEPFFVIEGKRLFTPPDKKRKREYVTGEEGASSGGIQRFKLRAHGSQISTAALIGYVQENDFIHWFNIINQWINDLSNNPEQQDISWSIDDKLKKFSINGKTSKATSLNKRIRFKHQQDNILLYHLWIDMQ